jgi:X-linked retinitis pigmentosa GTPase regulator
MPDVNENTEQEAEEQAVNLDEQADSEIASLLGGETFEIEEPETQELEAQDSEDDMEDLRIKPKPKPKARRQREPQPQPQQPQLTQEQIQRLQAMESGDAEAVLRSMGYDPLKLAEQMILGGNESTRQQTEKEESELLARIERLEKERNDERLGKARLEALNEINDDLDPEQYFWLAQEDNPAETVLNIIRANYQRTGEKLEISEAAEKAEKFYASRAKKLVEAHEQRFGKPKRKKSAASSVGGSASRVSYEGLPDEEKDRLVDEELKKLLEG